MYPLQLCLDLFSSANFVSHDPSEQLSTRVLGYRVNKLYSTEMFIRDFVVGNVLRFIGREP